MSPNPPRDDLSPNEAVDLMKEGLRNGRIEFLMKTLPEDRKRISEELDPYMEIPVEIDTENGSEQARLYIINKPFGVEFRSRRPNVKAGSPKELEDKIVDLVPPLKSEDVNVTFVSEQVVVTVPYKEAYKPEIGLFVNPDMIMRMREKGAGNVGGYFTIENTINEVMEDLLDNPENYSINEMHKGSLLHKTRENMEPGKWRTPPWVEE